VNDCSACDEEVTDKAKLEHRTDYLKKHPSVPDFMAECKVKLTLMKEFLIGVLERTKKMAEMGEKMVSVADESSSKVEKYLTAVDNLLCELGNPPPSMILNMQK
jgi:hypothetical protein